MERMTRNDAAEFLGVNAQTISNWVEKGLLGGYLDKESRRFYVNADDVRKYAEKFKMLSVSKELLDAEYKEMEEAERKINKKIQRLAYEVLGINGLYSKTIGDDICNLFFSIVDLSIRERDVMGSLFHGGNISDIAYKNGISQERVRQIIIKDLRKMAFAAELFGSLKKENESQKEEISKLKTQLALYGGESEDENSGDIPFQAFSYKLCDCHLSVRSMNCIRSTDIETIGELAQYTEEQLLSIRNFGRKSLCELGGLLQSFGLTFGMKKAKVYAKGLIRMRNDKEMDRLLDGYLAKFTSEIENRLGVATGVAMRKAIAEMSRYVGLKNVNKK